MTRTLLGSLITLNSNERTRCTVRSILRKVKKHASSALFYPFVMIFKYPKSVNPEAKVTSRCKLQNTKSSRKGSENVLRRNSISLKGQSTGCLIKFQMKENLKFTFKRDLKGFKCMTVRIDVLGNFSRLIKFFRDFQIIFRRIQ